MPCNILQDTGGQVQIRWAGFAWHCEYQAKRNRKCFHKTAIVNKPGVDEHINIIVAFGFIIPVKIAKALHIQPNFPYSMMAEVLQTRLQKRL